MSTVSHDVMMHLLRNKSHHVIWTTHGYGETGLGDSRLWPAVCPGHSHLGPASGFPGTVRDDMEL